MSYPQAITYRAFGWRHFGIGWWVHLIIDENWEPGPDLPVFFLTRRNALNYAHDIAVAARWPE